jgi:hypothetical protein
MEQAAPMIDTSMGRILHNPAKSGRQISFCINGIFPMIQFLNHPLFSASDPKTAS